jgi:hypothetical protein
MSRRVIAVLTAVCLAALSVTAVALASGGGSDHQDGAAKKHRAPAAKQRGIGGGILGVALTSLAQRLDVAPVDLRAAVTAIAREQAAKKAAAAGLTPEEIAALKACRTARHGASTCDRAAAKSGRAKLKALPKPDLTALKAELATSLATKLSKTPDEVLTAVRAELDARLTQAVTAGWLTQKGHDLALACFDTPATCDLKALRAEVRFFGHGHAKRKHAPKHHKGEKPTTTTPAPTPPSGSGQMTPGGRSSSTPLR